MTFLKKFPFVFAVAISVLHAENSSLVLRYDTPVNPEIVSIHSKDGPAVPNWGPKKGNETIQWDVWGLPLGNGRLGALFYGNTEHESIPFNEKSLWTGNDVWAPLPQPKVKGQPKAPKPTSTEKTFGSYQPFGNIEIDLPHGSATDYERKLDLERGVGTVSYSYNGTKYQREYFVSYPDQVLVVRLTADHPGGITGKIRLTDRHLAKITTEGNTITAHGSLADNLYTVGPVSQSEIKMGTPSQGEKAPKPLEGNNMVYESQMKVIVEGGSASGKDGEIQVENANSILILLAAGTDYVPDFSKHWKGTNPHEAVSKQLDAAAARPYAELLERHLKDYQSLFGSFHLDLGQSSAAKNAMTTEERLIDYRKNPADPELEALVAQYGRYLIISSSRPGAPPANLQGIWNPSAYFAPWSADYHLNINLQMNYWLTGPANLPECIIPLGDWMASLMPHSAVKSKEYFGPRGIELPRELNIFGGANSPNDKVEFAWILQNLYEHYAYTGDKEWMEKVLYPMIEQAVYFWEDHLIEKNGELLVPQVSSPEHGPVEDGVYYAQEMVWELFKEYGELSTTLGVNQEHAAKIEAMRKRLSTPKIGSIGQLMEWQTEYLSTEKAPFRHISHLVGLYPGRQIAPNTTPDLAKGAAVSLTKRGDAATGWAKVHKAACWARLLDGNHAMLLYRLLIQDNLMPNLFDMINGGDKFQIDANFGAPIVVCEMLLQSQTDEIVLLPALPRDWPTGSVQGICARGGFVLDLSWADGKLKEVTIHSNQGNPCKIRYQDHTVMLSLKKGEEATLNTNLQKK